MVATLAVFGSLLASGAPVLAVSDQTQGSDTEPQALWNPKEGYPEPALPDPVTIPGTGTTVQPFTDIAELKPISPDALPEANRSAEDSRASAAVAVNFAAPGTGGDATTHSIEDDDVLLGCTPGIDKSTASHTEQYPGRLDGSLETVRIVDVIYTGTLKCNFNLPSQVWAAGTAGVVDRTPKFDDEVLSIANTFQLSTQKEGRSAGQLALFDEWDDHGRQVEVVLDVHILLPPGFTWGYCNPIPGLRYLLCDGLGANYLHAVVGTGAFSTGLKPPVVEYVALGDSYSSGTGTRSYPPGPLACYRSDLAYSGRIVAAGATFRGMPVAQPRLGACHGATISSFYSRQSGTERPQANWLSPYTTRLVTVSIGGNDLGFPEIAKSCINPLTDCSTGGPLVTDAQLFNTAANLTNLLTYIKSIIRLDGKVVVLDYPIIVPDSGISTGSCPVGLNPNEVRLLAETTKKVNGMVERAVRDAAHADIVFVDVQNAFASHSICDTSPWAHSLTAPLDETYHPTREGHQAIANILRSRLLSMP